MAIIPGISEENFKGGHLSSLSHFGRRVFLAKKLAALFLLTFKYRLDFIDFVQLLHAEMIL